MLWNWQLADWPKFWYSSDTIATKEKEFLVAFGSASAYLKSISKQDYTQFIVEILSEEGKDSSRIEGEILDRESLQSSIRKHFGLHVDLRAQDKEARMAELLCDVYESFSEPLTHETLWRWHSILFNRNSQIEHGAYRSHKEPMQIVSRRYDLPRIYFEAPPSEKVFEEMERFLDWMNAPIGAETLLGRVAIAHIYFESIHPFEDGNGRIGRALVEKMFSKYLKRPTLIAVSKTLDARKKEYYNFLGTCNRSLDATAWVAFFADAVMQAQADSMRLLNFLLNKSKMCSALSGRLNPRQEKALLRMFEEGPDGFVGGMSAEKYIAITKTSRATASRDLAELVDMGAFTKTGQLRHTRYWLRLVSNSIS